MRLCLNIIILVATMLWSTGAIAGPPLPGTYTSTDIGGAVPPGRYSEGWGGGGSGGALLAGATLNCGSWDGASFGLVWRYTCATQLTNAVMILDTVDGSGNGQRTWKCTYSGGVFWLSGTGPWAGGDADYPGVFDSYIEYETEMYAGGIVIGVVTTVQTAAHFDNYPRSCMEYSISNGVRLGTTDLGQVEPAGYPPFLQAGTCAPVMPQGAWWNMNGMTLRITGCEVPVQQAAWGDIKSLYR
jgi:hypothetical protein